MRILFILLLITQLFGQKELELFNVIFPQMLHKKKIKVLTKLKLDSHYFIVVNSCKQADIVIGKFKCNKPTFLLDYYDFKDDKNAIGAFYWRKGRPQLRFRKTNIYKYHLYVSKDFRDYLE